MREILFKAKRKNWRELPKEEWWVEGLPSYGINGEITEIEHWKDFANCEVFEIDPETICQYIGMKDKDWNIWENDILDISEEMHSVTYQDGKFVSESNWVNKYRHKVEFTPGSLMNTQRYLADGNITCKKIGNYIDNPELLERS